MSIYDQIIDRCQPYWQVRSNHIHIPESYRLAQALLAHYPEADATIVLPAIQMHDNGYANVPPETLFQGLQDSPLPSNSDITRLHEIEGAKIARTILESLAYDPAKIDTICQIIDGHDSRMHSLSLEDALVKDADKLWRFSLIGVQTAGRDFMQMEPLPFLEFCVGRIDKWMFTTAANRMAKEMAEETRAKL